MSGWPASAGVRAELRVQAHADRRTLGAAHVHQGAYGPLCLLEPCSPVRAPGSAHTMLPARRAPALARWLCICAGVPRSLHTGTPVLVACRSAPMHGTLRDPTALPEPRAAYLRAEYGQLRRQQNCRVPGTVLLHRSQPGSTGSGIQGGFWSALKHRSTGTCTVRSSDWPAYARRSTGTCASRRAPTAWCA